METGPAEVVDCADGKALRVQSPGGHSGLEEIGPGLVFIIGSHPETRHYPVFHTAAPAKKIAGVMAARSGFRAVVSVSIFRKQFCVRAEFSEVTPRVNYAASGSILPQIRFFRGRTVVVEVASLDLHGEPVQERRTLVNV